MTTGRFDVVVVGARTRGSQAVKDLAVAVGRVTGLAPGAVQRGLEGGEVVVHAGLSKTHAVLAARTVQQLGAIVDVRPARSDEGGPTIEPDWESEPAALEAVLESAPMGVPTSPPPVMIVPPSAPAAVRPTAAMPAANPAGPLIDPNAPALNLGGPPVASRFVAPAAMDAKLELDFAGVGLTAPPPGTSALMRGSAMSQSGSPASRGSGSFPAIDPAASMRAQVSGAHPTIAASRAPGLLAYDRIASALFGTAIAAAIGMLIAFAFVRGDARAVAEKLEPELREAIGDPLGVEAGRRRAPATITAEIDAALADVRTTYLLVWASIALPFGMLAGFLKRPS